MLPGGGCGYHPAPASFEDRHPEPVKTCTCEQPLPDQRDGEPIRCYRCSRALPGQRPAKETFNGEQPVDIFLLDVMRQHQEAKIARHQRALRAIGAIEGEPDE